MQNLVFKNRCQECRSFDLSWFCSMQNKSDVVDGRLRLHDISASFVLGCNECSATVQVVSADRLAQNMTDNI